MIFKDEDNIIFKFGTGDINMNSGSIEVDGQKLGIITYNNQSPRSIGKNPDTGQYPLEVNLYDFPAFMTFSKVESIDSLILSLECAKVEMLK